MTTQTEPAKKKETIQDLLSSIDSATLVSALFKKKDPSWSQLNRIISRKEEEAADFPFHNAAFNEFGAAGKNNTLFTTEEKTVINLEAKDHQNQVQLENMKKQIESVRQKSYQKGLAEGTAKGRKEGYASAKKEMDTQINQIQQNVSTVLSALENEKTDIYRQAEQMINKLVTELVRKVIVSEIKTNPRIIENVARTALNMAQKSSRITIKVNPKDALRTRENISFWMPVNNALSETEIVEDERIQRGGCIVDTGNGQVDARIETQLAEMEQIIQSTWENAGAETTEETSSTAQ